MAAHFGPMGNRLSGDSRLEVERITMEGRTDVWYFHVSPVADYVFLRAPVVDNCAVELVATRQGESNPEYGIFRWVASPNPGVLRGGNYDPPNLLVPFVVLGYRPSALIQRLTQTA